MMLKMSSFCGELRNQTFTLAELKDEARAGAARAARRTETALEVFAVKQVFDVTKEPDLTLVIAERQRVAGAQISFGESFESESAAESKRIENASEVIARSRKVEVNQQPATDTLRRDERE